MPSLLRLFVSAAVAGAALLGAAPGLIAQGTGTIQGEVREAGSNRPLGTVQVFAPESGRGTLTNASGRFILLNVPPGQVRVEVRGVGYAPANQTVAVGAGETARVTFTLQQTAIALDEVVVTGAGVATERRKLGNTVATIDAAQTIEQAPVTTVSEVLQGREPGVVGLPSGGLAGEGSRIRIRSSSSLSRSNEPIIYVDGIRVDNAGGFGRGVGAGGGGTPSRLDDINPAAIERIEILKGAAAATLYGTEASNGVIQIFTKQGQSGAPRWSFQVEQGFSEYPEDAYPPAPSPPSARRTTRGRRRTCSASPGASARTTLRWRTSRSTPPSASTW
jgi:TonB-dependent SusC/RagA subfamily outer membrane receptor